MSPDDGYIRLAIAVLNGLDHEYRHALRSYQERETMDAAIRLRNYEREIKREYWYYDAISMGVIESPEWYINAHRRLYGLERMDLDAEIAYMQRKMFADVTRKTH